MEYLWTPWRMSYISGNTGTATGAGEDNPQSETQTPAIQNPNTRKRVPEIQNQQGGCVFCDRARLPEAHDRESLIVLRGEHNFVILNLYPYNSAHLMVVPYEHTADLAGLEADTTIEMMALVQKMVRVISAEYNPEGFNVGMNLGRTAGAGVADHLHMHLVPRWAGDTNFMPVVGGTKVMPELLETTLDRLRKRAGYTS